MSKGACRPWLQLQALFRAGVGAAWCVALGFCAFLPWSSLVLKTGGGGGGEQGEWTQQKQYHCKNASLASSDLAAWVPCVPGNEEDLGRGGSGGGGGGSDDAPCWEML